MPSKEYSDIIKATLSSPAHMKQKLMENREKLTDAAFRKAFAAAESIESLFSVSDKMIRVISYIFEKLEEVYAAVEENRNEIDKIYKKMESHYQKVGIVKYDAFHEMGGNLSFVLTMLDENNNGWIFNAMHSREGCYTYIKEVVKGDSYIELSAEERQCLEKAVYQEEYDIKDIKK